MSAPSPGQAACEAFWTAVGTGPDGQPEDAALQWAQTMHTLPAWEAAAQAAITAYADRHGPWAERAAEILTEGQP